MVVATGLPRGLNFAFRQFITTISADRFSAALNEAGANVYARDPDPAPFPAHQRLRQFHLSKADPFHDGIVCVRVERPDCFWQPFACRTRQEKMINVGTPLS